MSVHYPKEWLEARDLGGRFATGRRPGPLARLARAFAAWRRRRTERSELHGMTSAELRDIGITRADVARVFGPGFVREYARRGSPAAVRTARR